MTALSPVLLLDFDGTAAVRNVGMALIERFSRDDAWRGIDDDYGKGKFGSKRAYELLGPLMEGGEREWGEFLERGFDLDEGLASLVQTALGRGWRVEILSDGLDFYIERLLNRSGVKLPIRAGTLKEESGGAVITTPHASVECGYCGTCKTARVRELSGEGRKVVFVGDGLSDRCAAPNADMIFAKDILAKHLSEKKIPFIPFKTLRDVENHLFV